MIRFLADPTTQVVAGVLVSSSTVFFALFARSKPAAVLSIIFAVLMGLTALDLMTDNMVIVGLAEVMGAVALVLLVMGLVFVWKHRLLFVIGYLLAAAFMGLMATNLGIERFGSHSEWWYNFQTFQAWATGATLLLLLMAIPAAFVKVRQIARTHRTPKSVDSRTSA